MLDRLAKLANVGSFFVSLAAVYVAWVIAHPATPTPAGQSAPAWPLVVVVAAVLLAGFFNLQAARINARGRVELKTPRTPGEIKPTIETRPDPDQLLFRPLAIPTIGTAVPVQKPRIPLNLTPAELCGLYNRKLTDYQAKKVVAEYAGKEVDWLLEVTNVDMSIGGKLQVTAEPPETVKKIGSIWVFAVFSDDRKDEVNHLIKGSRVRIVAEVESFSHGTVQLIDSRIVPG